MCSKYASWCTTLGTCTMMYRDASFNLLEVRMPFLSLSSQKWKCGNCGWLLNSVKVSWWACPYMNACIHVHVHSQPFSFHLTQTSITWWLKCYTFPTNMYRAHTLHSECITSNKMLNINRRVRGRKAYADTLSNNNVVKEEVSNSHAEPSPKNLLLHFSTYQFGIQVSWHCTRTWVQHKHCLIYHNYLQCATVYAEIFKEIIFRELNIRGVKFLWFKAPTQFFLPKVMMPLKKQ